MAGSSPPTDAAVEMSVWRAEATAQAAWLASGYFAVELSRVGLLGNSKVIQRLQVQPGLCIPTKVAR
jgi:hypothetical protein